MAAADPHDLGHWSLVLTHASWDHDAQRTTERAYAVRVDHPDASIAAVRSLVLAVVRAAGFHPSTIKEAFGEE